MAQPMTPITDERWSELLARVRVLPAARQEEILDYIGFILEREGPDSWDLTEDDRARIARHLAGDMSDTVALEDVEEAILRGAVDEL